MWNYRLICQAWIRKGYLDFEWTRIGRRTLYNPILAKKCKQDHDLALEMAEYNWRGFYVVGPRLLYDKSFMMRAVERDGRVLNFASARLMNDFDILAVAVSRHGTQHEYVASERPPPSVQSCLGLKCDLCAFEAKVREKLDSHYAFMYHFLRGITCQGSQLDIPPASRSNLPMLDLGMESSYTYKRMIAEYCDIPVGQELARLRKVLLNLERPVDPYEYYIRSIVV
jgi:hypothetical protein